ncbi:MAG: MarR family transcriptional regulator, partial [Oscillospiraceae bacterium]|nr:MarR family transcriptional regulator [Oscillospiraceae bacterium]
AGCDITPVQSQTLVYLSFRGGREVNQRDLERELHLKPSTVNGIVGRLEDKGYIIRQTSPADGRCRLLRLTEAGAEKVAAFHAVLRQTARFYTNGLSEAEQAQLRELLARIIANLENEVNSV